MKKIYTFKRLGAFLLMLFCLTLNHEALAQSQDFVVYGRIKEMITKAPLANRAVFISDSAFGGTYSKTVYTNLNGQYADTLAGFSTRGVNGRLQVVVNSCNGNITNLVSTSFGSKTKRESNFEVCDTAFTLPCAANFKYEQEHNSLEVEFDNKSIGNTPLATYSWDFGDGNTSTKSEPDHIYAAPGLYYVCLTLNNGLGCTSTFCDSVDVQAVVPDCDAKFSYFKNGYTLTLVNQSKGNTFSWDLGNGTASNAKNPTVTFATHGTYTICLVSSDSASTCSDTICRSVKIDSNAVQSCSANFRYTPKVNPQEIAFSNLSYGGRNIGYSSSWDFGDGSTSTSRNPVHNYSNSGWYYVCLTITTSTNCTSTYCDSILVQAPVAMCNANFSYYKRGNDVYFNNSSTGTRTYAWSFGDGSVSMAKNPMHNYAGPGTYNVCLVAMDSVANCSDTICKNVKIDTIPVIPCNASFTYRTYNKPLEVKFTNRSTGGMSQGSTFVWNFGDGNTSSSTNPTHQYAAAGTYQVCLTVTTATCTNMFCDSITVTAPAPNCTAAFTYYKQGSSVFFFNQSRGLSAHWDFGDGTVSTSRNPSHTYNTAGTYNVCLVSIDSTTSCTDTICQSVKIDSIVVIPCQADFSSRRNPGSSNKVFFMNRSLGFDPTTTYVWSFGDGDSSRNINPYHVYAQPGIYYVCLTMSNSNGCTSTYCDSVMVTNFTPSCNASFTDSIMGLTVNFTNNSTAGLTYLWSFGDGNTSNISNPSHTYAQPGVYQVCLTVIDSMLFCIDVECETVKVGLGWAGSLFGTVYTGQSTASAGLAYLIVHDTVSQKLTAIDTVRFGRSGTYVFNNVAPGNYLVKAQLLRHDPSYRKYLPTYYGDSLLWSSATTITAPNSASLDINMVRGKNRGGPGFVGGLIAQGAGFVGGTGVNEFPVYLIDHAGEPMLSAISDSSGNYDFEDLDYGTYQVVIDFPGAAPVYRTIVISPSVVQVVNVDFTVNSQGVVTSTQTPLSSQELNIYPVPASTDLNIVLPSQLTNVEVVLLNSLGQEVQSRFISRSISGESIRFNIADMAAGVYFVKVKADQATMVKTITKSN